MVPNYELETRDLCDRLFALGRTVGVEESGVQGENAEKSIKWAKTEAQHIISILVEDAVRLSYLEKYNART